MSDSMAFLYAAGIYLACLALMFWNYGTFTSTIVRWAKKPIVDKNSMKIKQPPMTFKESIKCYIPIYQACIVNKTLYHRTNHVLYVIAAIASGGIVVNLFNKFVLAINMYVMLACNIIMLVSLIYVVLLYGYVTANCAHIYGFGWLCTILCFIAPCVACWYLNNNVPRKMRAIHKEEIFHEHSGDTVLRQKHHK